MREKQKYGKIIFHYVDIISLLSYILKSSSKIKFSKILLRIILRIINIYFQWVIIER